MVGGAGIDYFIFGETYDSLEKDTIKDWESGDKIRFHGRKTTESGKTRDLEYDDLNISQDGNDTIIKAREASETWQIVIEGTVDSTLVESDFSFIA